MFLKCVGNHLQIFRYENKQWSFIPTTGNKAALLKDTRDRKTGKGQA